MYEVATKICIQIGMPCCSFSSMSSEILLIRQILGFACAVLQRDIAYLLASGVFAVQCSNGICSINWPCIERSDPLQRQAWLQFCCSRFPDLVPFHLLSVPFLHWFCHKFGATIAQLIKWLVMVIGYGLAGRCTIPCKIRVFFFLLPCWDILRSPPCLLSNGHRRLFLWC
jgi:hypothetical protein